MRWMRTSIASVCLRTIVRDPRLNPDSVFRYVDIASIDRGLKVIAVTQVISGAQAPSRARKEVQQGDILVSTVRPNLNAVAVVPIELHGQIASTGFCVLRPNAKAVESRYLFYFTQTPHFVDTLVSKVRGAHYPAVSDIDVKNVEMPLPPLSEQRRIIGILEQADVVRERRAEADNKAEHIMPALFYKMFGDPVTNSRQWPTERLADAFEIFGGGTPSKSEPNHWTGNIPWVSPKDMKCDVIRDTEDHITDEAIEASATRLVKEGSILVVYRSGILAHSFPVAIAGRDLTINQDLKALTSKGMVTNLYLYGWLTAAPSIGLECVKKGATVHNVDGSRFVSLQIPVPPKDLQESFSAILGRIIDQRTKRRQVGKRIELLHALLMRKAFAGDLTARWREAHTKELMAEMEEQAKSLAVTI